MLNELTKRIIPCLDVKNARVVKGVNFVGLKDAGDPVEVAKRYNAEGADELCFLDITASHEERDTIVHVVQAVAKEVFIPLTVGGGIRTLDDVYRLLAVGCDKVSVNSHAIKNPDFINEAAYRFGSSTIVAAIDAKKVAHNKWNVFINGGRLDTNKDVIEWGIELQERGAGEILLTSMDADGTKAGFDTALTELMSQKLQIPVIASGGAGNISHFCELFETTKASAALAASIFHFKEVEICELKNALFKDGVAVRL